MKIFACFCSVLVICVVASCQEQGRCGSEVKLLLSPDELKSALTRLKAKKEAPGRVNLFDTSRLELLSQGVIVRLRTGTTADLMVKVRTSADKEIAFERGDDGRYKCEVDVTADGAVRSYSIRTTFAGPVAAAGTDVFALLSPAQRTLLQQAHVGVDWRQVRIAADIQSSTWRVRGKPTMPRLTLELWRWSTGAALDLSAKLEGDQTSALTQLQQFATSKGLVLNPVQKLKTALALKSDGRNAAPGQADDH